MQNLDLLDELIVGRVEPNIYAFSTNTVPNYLKVGDTYRPVAVRLNEWKKYFPNLVEEYHDSAAINDDLFFRDFAVHQYLENDLGKNRLQPDQIESGVYYSREFFEETSVDDVTDAISDIKASYASNMDKYQYYSAETHLPETYTYASTGLWKARPNQKAAVDAFDKAVKAGRTNLLMYAVMRFGKSFTSLLCAKRMNAHLVLVVSAKADVREEWKKTVQSADNFNKEYSFLSSDDLVADDGCIEAEFSNDKSVVVFLTLQDLQGEDIKDKHKQIFSNKVDLLIVDETHYGARAEKYGQVLQGSKHKKDGDDYIDVDEAEEQLKVLDARIRLHLSGTPYRILMGSEFSKEDIIAFCQFTDIVQAQSEWDAEHILSDDVKEWDNPYYGFPQMIRFAFYPSESAKQKLEQLKKDGFTYAFSALLKPKSIAKDVNGLHKKFVYEEEVAELLQAIDGSKQDKNVLSFLDYDKIKDGNMCRHMVIVLPFCASCDAMEELITSNKDKFKNLNKYKIINISGVDSPSKYRSVQDVKRIIREHEANNEKTITLTVNRMLTGSTVEEWDTMIYLKGTASPQEYDQAIFRLQNQYVRTMTDANGDEIKFNMKPQTLLVDFDPHRMFVMQEQKSLIYNANIEKGGNSKLKDRIASELKISPIITLNKDKIERVEPTDILAAVSEYSNSRGVMDETRDIPIDFSLLDIEGIRAVIEAQAEIGTNKGFETEASRGEGEGSDVDTPDDNDFGREDDEDGAGRETDEPGGNEEPAESDDTKVVENKFRTYYSRILFFAFLTKDRVNSLEEILSVISKGENARIANNLQLKETDLSILLHNMNAFILSQLDYKIQNINNLANDEDVESIQRAKTAIRKFERLSSSEIATPSALTAEMVEALPDSVFNGLLNDKHVVLDIASKAGEFAIAICNRCKELDIDINSIKDSVLSIPTSTIAYEFTRKVYELLGLNAESIAMQFNTYDLLKICDERDEINYGEITMLLSQCDTYESISINNKIKGGKKMHFNAIVGNPPYQENIGGTSNRSLSKQLFPRFVTIALNMESDYVSLITPSRWFTGNAQDRSFVQLRDYVSQHNHFSKIVNFLNSKDVFNEVSVPGGVNYFIYPQGYSGEIEFVEVSGDKRTTVMRPLFEEGLDVILPMNKMISILRKVKSKDFISMEDIVTGRNPFGIPATDKALNDITVKKPDNLHSLKVLCAYEEIRYIQENQVTRNRDLTKQWKVFTSKMNGGAGTLLDNKAVAILGKTFVMGPNTICSNTLLAVGCFDNALEANNLNRYMNTKFFRFMLGIKKIAQVLTSNIYSFVPQQDFSLNSDIDWNKPLEAIDAQLYKKYSLSQDEMLYIEKAIKESVL